MGRRSVGIIFAHNKGLGKFAIYLSDKAMVNVIPPRPVSPTWNEGGGGVERGKVGGEGGEKNAFSIWPGIWGGEEEEEIGKGEGEEEERQ